MPMYVIERDMPGAGALSERELQTAARNSREVIRGLAPGVQWQHSYFAEDKVFCVFIADSEEVVREHGARGGFPVTSVHRVVTTTNPTTAEE